MPRPVAPVAATVRSYASVLDRARALGLFAVVTIAPLGLAGSVAACGGARPAEARAYPTAGYVPPVAPIAPPASASAQPPPNEKE